MQPLKPGKNTPITYHDINSNSNSKYIDIKRIYCPDLQYFWRNVNIDLDFPPYLSNSLDKRRKVNSSQTRYWPLHSSPRTELPAGRSPPAQHTVPSGLNPWPAAQRTGRDARTPHPSAPHIASRKSCWTGSHWKETVKRQRYVSSVDMLNWWRDG